MYRIIIIEGDQHEPTTQVTVYVHDLPDADMLGDHLDSPLGDALHDAVLQMSANRDLLGTTIPTTVGDGFDGWVHFEIEMPEDLLARDSDYNEVAR